MRLLGWGLIQYDGCPYMRRRLGHRETRGTEMHMHRENDPVKRQQEGDHLRAAERPQWPQPCWPLDLALLPPELLETKFLLFKPLRLWHFVTAAPAD